MRLQIAAFALALAAGAAAAQETEGDAKPPKPYEPPPLFDEGRPLEITLTGPFRQIRRERLREPPAYRPGRVTYASDSGTVSLPVRLRVRGEWRRKNCDFPPLLMNFTKDSTKKSNFAKLDRLRLSPHCRDRDDYEQYILQDYQLYRVQRLLTPYTYNTRLTRVTYVDSEAKDTVRRWAFLQEPDEPFAERHDAVLVTQKGAGPADLDPYESAFVGVFQYFVGNTDFSIAALHNIVLLRKSDTHIPVARDFDWSGAVNARYAAPSEILRTRSVTQRVMRGLCAPEEEYQKVFALFRAKKDSIYALYGDPIGGLLNPKVVKSTLEYFDEFYATINDPRRARRDIIESCLAGAAD